MHALGFDTRFLTGLNGEPFPAGFRSSRLTVRQMADLITFIAEYGDRHGIHWSETIKAAHDVWETGIDAVAKVGGV
jgi:hypothetical protein